MAANLSKCTLKSLSPQCIELDVIDSSFIASRLQKDKNLSVLKQTASDFFGSEPKIVINSIQAEKKRLAQPGQDDSQKSLLRQNAVRHPLISDVVDILGGNIIDVKVIKKDT